MRRSVQRGKFAVTKRPAVRPGAEPSASPKILRQHGPYLYIGTLRVTVRICRELGFRRMADRRLGSMGDRP